MCRCGSSFPEAAGNSSGSGGASAGAGEGGSGSGSGSEHCITVSEFERHAQCRAKKWKTTVYLQQQPRKPGEKQRRRKTLHDWVSVVLRVYRHRCRVEDGGGLVVVSARLGGECDARWMQRARVAGGLIVVFMCPEVMTGRLRGMYGLCS